MGAVVVTAFLTLSVERAAPPLLDLVDPRQHVAPISVALMPSGTFPTQDEAQLWVLPQEPGSSPDEVPPDLQSAHELGPWARRHGGVPADTQTVRLVLRGTGDAPVVITRVRPFVLSKEPPVEGWTWSPPAEGGFLPARRLEADLDCPDTAALLYDVIPLEVAEPVPTDGPLDDEAQGSDEEPIEPPASAQEAWARRYELLAAAEDLRRGNEEFLAESASLLNGGSAPDLARDLQLAAADTAKAARTMRTAAGLLSGADTEHADIRRYLRKQAELLDISAGRLSARSAAILKDGSVETQNPEPSEEPPGSSEAQVLRPVTLVVSKEDVEQIDLSVEASSGSYKWALEVAYEKGGTLGSLTVKNDQFRVTSLEAAESYSREGEQWVADPRDPEAVESYIPCGSEDGLVERLDARVRP